jgi:hypothetical protein
MSAQVLFIKDVNDSVFRLAILTTIIHLFLSRTIQAPKHFEQRQHQ